jgi:ADP-L-glycero-D-manno-heptose 6-epimerase
MIVVTGGAGFIGSNLIRSLNERGYSNILLVDNLENGKKIHNLNQLNISDIILRDDFINQLENTDYFNKIEAIFHLGACSSTNEWDGNYLIRNNFEYSKSLLFWCVSKNVPFIYASSASVYGLGLIGFSEELACEKPINAYAYSKFIFDQYVRNFGTEITSQVVGLRYFNVYGCGEYHKQNMTSPIFNFYQQIKNKGKCNVFKGSHGVGDGEHQRDFVHVQD